MLLSIYDQTGVLLDFLNLRHVYNIGTLAWPHHATRKEWVLSSTWYLWAGRWLFLNIDILVWSHLGKSGSSVKYMVFMSRQVYYRSLLKFKTCIQHRHTSLASSCYKERVGVLSSTWYLWAGRCINETCIQHRRTSLALQRLDLGKPLEHHGSNSHRRYSRWLLVKGKSWRLQQQWHVGSRLTSILLL